MPSSPIYMPANNKRVAGRVLFHQRPAGTPRNVLNLEDVSEADIENVKSNYLKGNLEAAVSNVTDDLVNEFAVAGTSEECLEKLRNHIGTGLKCPILYIHGPDYKQAAQLAAEKIAPNLVPK